MLRTGVSAHNRPLNQDSNRSGAGQLAQFDPSLMSMKSPSRLPAEREVASHVFTGSKVCGNRGLSSAGMPDRAGRLIVQPFTPDDLAVAVIVDGESEIISERKTEAVTRDIAIAGNESGNSRLFAPRRSSVTGTAIERIPVRQASS